MRYARSAEPSARRNTTVLTHNPVFQRLDVDNLRTLPTQPHRNYLIESTKFWAKGR